MLRAARIASRRSPLCAAAPVRGWAVGWAARRVWRATASYGEAGSQWRGRLVLRTPIGRTVPAGAVKYALHGSTGSLGSLPNLLWLGLTAGCLLAQGQLATLAMGMGDNSMGGRPYERSPNKRAAQHLLRNAADPAHPTIAEARASLAEAGGSPGQAPNIQRQVRRRQRKASSAASGSAVAAAKPSTKGKLKLGGKGSRKNQNQRAHAARETKAFEQLQQEAFQEAVREYRTQWELQQMGGEIGTVKGHRWVLRAASELCCLLCYRNDQNQIKYHFFISPPSLSYVALIHKSCNRNSYHRL